MKKIISLAVVFCMFLSVSAAALNLKAVYATNDSVLDPNFKYEEPTFVSLPDSVEPEEEGEKEGDEKDKPEGYSFIYNNVRVMVTKGELEPDDGTYSVDKGGSITFTTTKSIKGLVINGIIKEFFNATSNKGQMEAMYPNMETTAYPALIVKNINDTSVTITCGQELECLYALVYFRANPEETIHGRTAPGEDIVVNCNNIMAEYTPVISYDEQLDKVVIEHDYQLYMSYNNGIDSAYMVSFRLIAENKGELAGQYSYTNANLIPEESFCNYSLIPTDFSTGVDGLLTISSLSAEQVFVSGYLICKNNNLYYFDYKGEMPILDPTQGVEQPRISTDGQMYDVLGRPVFEGYKGFVIRDGKKYIVY